MTFKSRVNVLDQGFGRLPDQGPLEMLAGQVVLLLEIESQAQFQTHAHQVGPTDQDGPEGRDGLVQERLAFLVREPAIL